MAAAAAQCDSSCRTHRRSSARVPVRCHHDPMFDTDYLAFVCCCWSVLVSFSFSLHSSDHVQRWRDDVLCDRRRLRCHLERYPSSSAIIVDVFYSCHHRHICRVCVRRIAAIGKRLFRQRSQSLHRKINTICECAISNICL